MTERKNPDAISQRTRNAGRFERYVPRKREPNEALPNRNSVWERPVYVPARDNR